MALTNEDLLAISQILDVKLKAEIQPIKNEIQTLRSELQTKLQALGSELHTELQALGSELHTELQALDSELHAELQALGSELHTELQALGSELHTELQALDSELHAEIHQIKMFQENVIMPQLNTITDCYTSTFHRYKDSVEGYEALQADNEVMKNVIMEHSEKLQKLA
ncbi:hypothetical protein [Acetatifactor muris]|uniref:hypothetical protein n=1 Tax=Acetatifactor muris TaxID=879566 RepID=UPI0023F15866|nr:hypothetical protein [Acetatifactor muris]